MKTAHQWNEVWKSGDMNIWELVAAIQADAAEAQREADVEAIAGFNIEDEDFIAELRRHPLVTAPAGEKLA
jgi:hypothetical protein